MTVNEKRGSVFESPLKSSTFTATGGNLHITCPDAEAKAFSKKLVRNAIPGFRDLLDERKKQKTAQLCINSV